MNFILQASESPGMSRSQLGSFGPPTISHPSMISMEYNFPGFKPLPPVSSFQYSTQDAAEEDLTLSNDALIGELFADNCRNCRRNMWSGNNGAALLVSRGGGGNPLPWDRRD